MFSDSSGAYVFLEVDRMGSSFFARMMSRERVPMHKIWAQFEACQKKGMTRHIGVSNFNVQLLLDIFTYAETMPYCNQVEHHPFYQ